MRTGRSTVCVRVRMIALLTGLPAAASNGGMPIDIVLPGDPLPLPLAPDRHTDTV